MKLDATTIRKVNFKIRPIVNGFKYSSGIKFIKPGIVQYAGTQVSFCSCFLLTGKTPVKSRSKLIHHINF